MLAVVAAHVDDLRALAIAWNAASATASGSPTNVTTVRFVSAPESTSSSLAPPDRLDGVGDLLDLDPVPPLGKSSAHIDDSLVHLGCSFLE